MKLRRLVPVAFLVALAVGTTGAQERESTPLTDAARARLRKADLVFVGKVRRLGDAPGVLSGVVLVRQAVVYEVRKILAGRWSPSEAAVHHILVGPPLALRTGELDPQVFRAGRAVVVAGDFAQAVPFGPASFPYLLVDDSEQAPLDATPETVKAVVAALAGR